MARSGLLKDAYDSRLGLGEEAAKKKEIVKESLSEYFLYTVEGRDTIPTGWSKRLPSFQAPEVPITRMRCMPAIMWEAGRRSRSGSRAGRSHRS